MSIYCDTWRFCWPPVMRPPCEGVARRTPGFSTYRGSSFSSCPSPPPYSSRRRPCFAFCRSLRARDRAIVFCAIAYVDSAPGILGPAGLSRCAPSRSRLFVSPYRNATAVLSRNGRPTEIHVRLRIAFSAIAISEIKRAGYKKGYARKLRAQANAQKGDSVARDTCGIPYDIAKYSFNRQLFGRHFMFAKLPPPNFRKGRFRSWPSCVNLKLSRSKLLGCCLYVPQMLHIPLCMTTESGQLA